LTTIAARSSGDRLEFIQGFAEACDWVVCAAAGNNKKMATILNSNRAFRWGYAKFAISFRHPYLNV
jgi:hypothetical protein